MFFKNVRTLAEIDSAINIRHSGSQESPRRTRAKSVVSPARSFARLYGFTPWNSKKWSFALPRIDRSSFFPFRARETVRVWERPRRFRAAFSSGPLNFYEDSYPQAPSQWLVKRKFSMEIHPRKPEIGTRDFNEALTWTAVREGALRLRESCNKKRFRRLE